MKNIHKLLISVIVATVAAAHCAQTNSVTASAPFEVSSRAANSEILTRTTYVKSPKGQTVPQVHHVTKIASGLNYWDGAAWTPSDPTFQVSPDGQYVYANKLQTKIQLAANLAANNSVIVTTPDGTVLNTTPIAIGLYDAVSGNSITIASITNCSGTIIGRNQVLYENAFNGLSGDIIYTLERGSFSQDIVWRQNIDPADYNFPTNSTRIQIFTAFNSPAPQQIARPLYVETNQAVRAQMASPDFIDHTLRFGQLKFGPGRAYSTTSTNRFNGAPIAKDFESINGQPYLIESIEYSDIKKLLQTLPRVSMSKPTKPRNHSHERKEAFNQQSPDHKGAGNRNPELLVIPTPGSATKARFAIKSAKEKFAETKESKGVIADYVALPATEPDPMVFQGDETYFVDGAADFDNVILEGGTCVKYPNDTTAYVEVDGTLTCETSEFLPATLTAADDDSIGQSMSGIWPGYTGTIQSGGYANPALNIVAPGGESTALNNLRVENAVTGIYSMTDVTVTNLQILNCGDAFYLYDEYSTTLENVLVANASTAIGGYIASGELIGKR